MQGDIDLYDVGLANLNNEVVPHLGVTHLELGTCQCWLGFNRLQYRGIA